MVSYVKDSTVTLGSSVHFTSHSLLRARALVVMGLDDEHVEVADDCAEVD